MDDLAERIKSSLENPNGDLWFADLTTDLVSRAWENLYRDIGLTPDSYSTARVLSRRIFAPRAIVASLKTCPSAGPEAGIAIEGPTPEVAVKYQNQGVSFYSPDEILNSAMLSCVEDAIAIINQVPSLMKTLAALVCSLHLIRPEDEDCDVSFSDPHIPFSIFVSVPQERISNDALRVAEAIVHETMHLQLTLIEGVSALSANDEEKYFSPWRQEIRNAQGLLHGLYVFVVIDRFLKHIRSSEYGLKRREEIGKDIGLVDSFKNSSDLTPLGKILVGQLLESRYEA